MKCLNVVSTVLVFYTMLISVVQTLKNDVASLMSTLSASPAIVCNASILDLLKFEFICWCKYYLTISSTHVLLVLCIQAFRDWRLSNNISCMGHQ